MGEKEEIKKITENIEEADKLQDLEELIKKNEFEFNVGDKEYRIKKPLYKEILELRKKKKEKFLELINDNKSIPQNQLIEQCKKKGYDIESWRNERIKIQTKINNLNLKLNEYGKVEENDAIKNLKLQIEELKYKQNQLINEENEFLQYSIEGQLVEYVNTYLLTLILEKSIGENKWERVFKNYEELQNSDDADLIIRAGYYLSLIMYRKY